MQLLLGVILIAGGVGYAIFMFKKHGDAALEMQYMQTTTVADAVEIIDNMAGADPNYRHFVELKGILQSVEPVKAPFTEREVAYYRNQCYSVNEETQTEKDSNGNTRTRVVKKENEIANERSSVDIFLKDDSSEECVYVDLESFGGDADLQAGCDRFEEENSAWVKQNLSLQTTSNSFHGAKFLGYRLKESVLNNHQPVYVLGELFKNGNRLYVGKSCVAKKPSKFTYKSEDQLVADTKKQRLLSLAIGIGAALVGIFILIQHFT